MKRDGRPKPCRYVACITQTQTPASVMSQTNPSASAHGTRCGAEFKEEVREEHGRKECKAV